MILLHTICLVLLASIQITSFYLLMNNMNYYKVWQNCIPIFVVNISINVICYILNVFARRQKNIKYKEALEEQDRLFEDNLEKSSIKSKKRFYYIHESLEKTIAYMNKRKRLIDIALSIILIILNSLGAILAYLVYTKSSILTPKLVVKDNLLIFLCLVDLFAIARALVFYLYSGIHKSIYGKLALYIGNALKNQQSNGEIYSDAFVNSSYISGLKDFYRQIEDNYDYCYSFRIIDENCLFTIDKVVEHVGGRRAPLETHYLLCSFDVELEFDTELNCKGSSGMGGNYISEWNYTNKELKKNNDVASKLIPILHAYEDYFVEIAFKNKKCAIMVNILTIGWLTNSRGVITINKNNLLRIINDVEMLENMKDQIKQLK